MSEFTTAAPPAPTIPITQIADAAVTAEKAILAAPPGTEPSYAKPAMAIFSLAIFAAIAVYAFIVKDHDMELMVESTSQAMAMTAIAYYLGSSSG